MSEYTEYGGSIDETSLSQSDVTGGQGPSKDYDGKRPEDREMWLNAWRDQLAGVRAFGTCLELADINGDGDSKLLIADAQKKLKVFSGTSRVSEYPLLDVPCSICAFYMDYKDEIRRPAVAIASGPYIFIYKNMRAHYKFSLPPLEVSQIEGDVWGSLKAGRVTVQAAIDVLEHARDNGVSLTARSLDLLSLQGEEPRGNFVNEQKNLPLIQQTVITSMTVLNKDKEEHGSVGCMVVGVENGRVLILDSNGASISRKVQLPSTPFLLCATGLLDVEYRILVACRNSSIYTIKNGELLGTIIDVESYPCAMVRVDKSVVVATMANTIHSYHVKGKKQFSIFMPCPITNLCGMNMETQRSAKSVLVALANGEVRMYSGKVLLNRMQMNDVVTSMIFGKYGREDNTLVMTLKSGSIAIKMLPRSANLEPAKGHTTGPPPEQDIPLKVPRKTKLYIEQTHREKEHGVEMHRVFQRELCKLRLQTARAYVKILTDGRGPLSYTAGSSLRLTAHVQGLGPLFKIKLNIQNTGTKALTSIPIVFSFNRELYMMKQACIIIPLLVPSLIYNYEVPVECVDEGGQGSDPIRVFVASATSNVPIITAIVNMPLADALLPT
jgi:Bardet-Biedl syndrome 1 protein